MASVATPEPPVEIVNNRPCLPAVPERRIDQVMEAIQNWPYWDDIKHVAEKEYQMQPGEYKAYLPEYQRFLGMNMLGYGPVGMFSRQVDLVWHSHILCTHLYLDFCLRLHGSLVNHVAQIPGTDDECQHCQKWVDTPPLLDMQEQTGPICTTCISCKNCSLQCKSESRGGMSKRAGKAQEFIEGYYATFHQHPPIHIWNLRIAEGCSAG